jgi:hypothetical protein
MVRSIFQRVSAEVFAGVDAAAGDARGDAAITEPVPVLVGVVALVRAQFRWPT